ncbi:hypothetical protein AB7M16_003019 [Bradyrhizobium sp. USDA 372]
MIGSAFIRSVEAGLSRMNSFDFAVYAALAVAVGLAFGPGCCAAP